MTATMWMPCSRRCRRPAMSALDADTVMSPGSGEAALRAAGAVIAAVDAVDRRRGRQRLLRRAAAGPSCRGGPADGLLPVQQRGDRRLSRARGPRPGADRGHRFRRASRQRHAADVRVATARCSIASTHQWPLYPGTGARSETGVGNIGNAPLPPGAGVRASSAPPSMAIVLPALDRFAPGAAADLGRLRRPSRRPARQPGAGDRGLRLGDGRADGWSRGKAAAAGSSPPSKAAMIWKRWPTAPPPMSATLMA